MKTRNVFAGAVVGALAVGIWLGSFWKGPGWGGRGTGFGVQESEEPVNLDRTHVRAPSTASSGNTTGKPVLPAPAEEMLTIAIYGDQYRHAEGETPQAGSPMSLTEIAQAARDTTGTPEGIRVRILKSKNAQEGARADLLKVLEENGVKREEIQERAEFID